MLYNIKLNHVRKNNQNDELNIEKKLLQEILGYTSNEAEYISSHFETMIATNLTSEEVFLIFYPFYNNNIHVYVEHTETKKIVALIDIEGYDLNRKQPAKDHYYDSPVITRDRLPDIYSQHKRKTEPIVPKIVQSKPQNIPKCPTCGSTNITKISAGERIVSVGILGLGSNKINKSYKCNNCKYTW